MKNYQLRVCIEAAELEIKCNNLGDFIEGSPIFDELSHSKKDTFQSQLDTMEDYLAILKSRVADFNQPTGG